MVKLPVNSVSFTVSDIKWVLELGPELRPRKRVQWRSVGLLSVPFEALMMMDRSPIYQFSFILQQLVLSTEAFQSLKLFSNR